MKIRVKSALRDTGLLGRCVACSLPLPLRLPEEGERSHDWICNGCGGSYRGVLVENWPEELRKNVRPAFHQREKPNLAAAPGNQLTAVRACQPHPISKSFPDHQRVPCKLQTDLSRRLDAELAEAANLQIQPQGDPFAKTVRRHGAAPYDKKTLSRFVTLVHRSSEQLGDLFTSLHEGGSSGLRVTQSISRDGLFRIAEDIDLFVNLALTPFPGEYPSRHSLRVSMVATSIGVSLGWDERTLLELSAGCLIHDVGMLALDQKKFRNRRVLSPADFTDITEHPLLALDLLEPYLHRIPDSARMIVYQMHERCNGSGYPRGYRAERIHPLAKIAAVADAFVALQSPRPHRPGMVPYDALKKILTDTTNGLYDVDVVRGLLNTVSLFPIGSGVTLNDGRVGTVIRATENSYDRPIVEAWHRDDPAASPSVVDLSQSTDLAISSALACLEH